MKNISLPNCKMTNFQLKGSSICVTNYWCNIKTV